MAQIDTSLTLIDATGEAVLTALNEQFGAFQSSFSGPVAPTLTAAGMLWFDTTSTTVRLNIRNITNTAWIMFPIDFITGNVIGATDTGSGGGSSAVDAGDIVSLVGDITGSGVFDDSGNVSVDTFITLPSIIKLDGGSPGEIYTSQNTGPYGTVGNNVIPSGGNIGQVLTKLSGNSFDVYWANSDISVPDLTSEYCPGYTYVNIDADEWRITGFDVTNLFNVGRRLKFIEGAITTYGTITVSTYTGGNTDMTMSMESAATLTTFITQVCLVSGVAGWSPIASAPFGGTSINDITVGDISGTTYLFAVGDLGKCGVSSNGGVTWTMLATGTIAHLNVCTYDSTSEQFWGGGNAGVLVDTTNATSITLDTTSIPALIGTTTYDIHGIAYSSTENGVVLLYHGLSTTWRTASSADQGTTWTYRANLGITVGAGTKSIKASVQIGGGTGISIGGLRSDVTAIRLLTAGIADTTFSTGPSVSPNIPSALGYFEDSAIADVFGCSSGAIIGNTNWTGDDSVTFSNYIRGFAYSSVHNRLVSVGDVAQIGYWDKSDKAVNDAWTNVENGFAPLANIMSVVWDGTNGIFVAVADNGEICRSTNGTN